jgi:hypothetical protein
MSASCTTPQTGTILHVHQIINLPGARAPNQEEMKQNALGHIGEGGPSGLAVLQVLPDHLDRNKSYRVDHAKQALVVEKERGAL